jgi:hypothetical protein
VKQVNPNNHPPAFTGWPDRGPFPIARDWTALARTRTRAGLDRRRFRSKSVRFGCFGVKSVVDIAPLHRRVGSSRSITPAFTDWPELRPFSSTCPNPNRAGLFADVFGPNRSDFGRFGVKSVVDIAPLHRRAIARVRTGIGTRRDRVRIGTGRKIGSEAKVTCARLGGLENHGVNHAHWNRWSNWNGGRSPPIDS